MGPPTILIQNSDGEVTSKSVSNGRIDLPNIMNMDKYTAGIELSNACRNYYTRRLRAAEGVKRKLGLSVPYKEQNNEGNISEDEGYTTQRPVPRRSTSIDKAMDRLKRELVSGCDKMIFFLGLRM